MSFPFLIVRADENLRLWNQLQHCQIWKTKDYHRHTLLSRPWNNRESGLRFTSWCVGLRSTSFADRIFAFWRVDICNRNGGRGAASSRCACPQSYIHDPAKPRSDVVESESLVWRFHFHELFLTVRSIEFNHFLSCILNKDPNIRMNPLQLLAHPFITEKSRCALRFQKCLFIYV